MGLVDRRIQYETAGLEIEDLLPLPADQLTLWYQQAEEAGAAEPNAMVVSTLDHSGHPDARVVLARGMAAFRLQRRATSNISSYVQNREHDFLMMGM